MLSLNVLALDDYDLKYYGDTATLEVARTEFIVKFIIYKTEEELNKKYQELTGTENEVRAFAQVLEGNPTCYVHLVPAELWDDREDMVILGHEIYHCSLSKHEKEGV